MKKKGETDSSPREPSPVEFNRTRDSLMAAEYIKDVLMDEVEKDFISKKLECCKQGYSIRHSIDNSLFPINDCLMHLDSRKDDQFLKEIEEPLKVEYDYYIPEAKLKRAVNDAMSLQDS